MDYLPSSLIERMPDDLRWYLKEQPSLHDIPICEQEPAHVASEVISTGTGQIKVYYPESSCGNMVVFLHFPGGICKSGVNRDQSWCSNMAKDSGSIYITVDYPSAPITTFRQILTDCLSTVEQVRQLCMGPWNETWNADPARIVLSGSSAGATLAIIIAVIAAQGNQPVYGLIALVPLIDTDPNFADNPWGENENTIGLTSDKLQRALDAAFRDEDPQFRDHWHNNPRKMPNDMIRKLPKMIMVSATLDILFPSQSDFKTRLQAQGVQLSSLEVDGLHQVKDLDRVTVAGREVRKYILQASRDFMKLAASPPDRGLAVVTRLQPEGAINRLKPYEVRRLEQL